MSGLVLRHVAQRLELGRRLAAREVHVVLLAVALHPDLERFRKRVHDRHADAVQTARHLVRVLVELAAGVQHRHRQLDTRHLFRRMNVDRNAAAVVVDGDRVVGVNRDVDVVRVAGERFVDRVVDDLVDEMVQSAFRRRADVHAGALPHRLETFEYLDLARVVLRAGRIDLASRSHDSPRKNAPYKYRKTARIQPAKNSSTDPRAQRRLERPTF